VEGPLAVERPPCTGPRRAVQARARLRTSARISRPIRIRTTWRMTPGSPTLSVWPHCPTVYASNPVFGPGAVSRIE